MLNKCVLIGRITFNLDIKRTENDTAIISNVIAVNRPKKGDEKIADFIPFTAWGKSAEYLYNYAEKGSLIALTGSIRVDTFEGKDGSKKKKHYVNAESVKIISEAAKKPSPPDEPKQETLNIHGEDEDLPF